MAYTQEAKELVQDAKKLLKSKATFQQLLKRLCALERQYGELKNRIKVSSGELNGSSEDVKILWELGEVADEIESKITKRVQELANAKLSSD